MIEILRDAVWQFVGAFLALAALVVSLWIYMRQKSERLLVYSFDYPVPLLSVHGSLKSEVEIRFQNRPVESAHMVVVTFVNRGNTPVTRGDFDEPLAISITGIERIVTLDSTGDTEVTGTFGDVDGLIEIEPFLLNASESVSIRAITINGSPSVFVRARIVGGVLEDKITFEKRLRRRIFRVLTSGKLIEVAGMFTAIALSLGLFKYFQWSIQIFNVK